MTRFTLTLLVLGSSALLAAAGVVAPVPRLPAVALPQPENDQPADGEAEDPAAIADRIAENTKKAGDQLGEFDAGDRTQKTQDQVLKDLDKLLNPPPMENKNNSSQSSDMSQSNDQSQSGNSNPQGGMNPPPPQGNSGGMQQPKTGNSGGMRQNPGGGQTSSRRGSRREQRDRERRQQQGSNQTAQLQPMPTGPKPMSAGGNPMPMPMQANGGDGQKPQGGASGGMNQTGTAAAGGVGGKSTPALPLDDAITKQVWGHLPEGLRQRMNQYYREQFMPKYSDLLREYYSSLAEKEKAYPPR